MYKQPKFNELIFEQLCGGGTQGYLIGKITVAGRMQASPSEVFGPLEHLVREIKGRSKLVYGSSRKYWT